MGRLTSPRITPTTCRWSSWKPTLPGFCLESRTFWKLAIGERFPEYEEWLEVEKTEKEEHWRKVKEQEGNPKGMLLFALETLAGKKASATAPAVC